MRSAVGWILLLVASLLCCSVTFGQLDAFLRIESIPGESTDANHQGWIDVESFSHSVANDLTGAPASHGDLSVTKRVDASSPTLFLRCCDSNSVGDVTFDVCRADDTSIVIYSIDLDYARVTSVTQRMADGVLMEVVTMSYRRIFWEFTPYSQGQAGTPVLTYWDVEQDQGGQSTP